jgi:hypothetical protein
MSTFRPANSHPNLPAGQCCTQRLADQFNADERLWEKLAPLRRLRRLLRPHSDPEKQNRQDLADFARAQQPKDCIGRAP